MYFQFDYIKYRKFRFLRKECSIIMVRAKKKKRRKIIYLFIYFCFKLKIEEYVCQDLCVCIICVSRILAQLRICTRIIHVYAYSCISQSFNQVPVVIYYIAVNCNMTLKDPKHSLVCELSYLQISLHNLKCTCKQSGPMCFHFLRCVFNMHIKHSRLLHTINVKRFYCIIMYDLILT